MITIDVVTFAIASVVFVAVYGIGFYLIRDENYRDAYPESVELFKFIGATVIGITMTVSGMYFWYYFVDSAIRNTIAR